jgi:hypothetical protein
MALPLHEFTPVLPVFATDRDVLHAGRLEHAIEPQLIDPQHLRL